MPNEEQTGVKVENQDAAGSGEPTPQTEEQKSEQSQQQQQQQDEMRTVPLSALKKVTEELKQLKEQNAALQAQMAFAGQAMGQQPNLGAPTPQGQQVGQVQQQQQSNPFEGLEDDEVLTVADAKKLLAQIPQQPAVDPNLYKEVQMLKLSVQEPQWQNVVQTYLPEMINNNPMLGQLIQMSPNPLEAALSVAKLNPRYVQAQQQNRQGLQQGSGDVLSQLDQLIANAQQQPASPDQFGGGSAINKADRFATMSDEEFDKHVQAVLAGKT